MCDHCAKVTSQKGYQGQVTCKCEHGDKKDGEGKDKDFGGCCSRKDTKTVGGCCGSACCAGTREQGGCCNGGVRKPEEGCLHKGTRNSYGAREAAGGCCMSGCCKDKNGKSKDADAPSRCCADNKK